MSGKGRETWEGHEAGDKLSGHLTRHTHLLGVGQDVKTFDGPRGHASHDERGRDDRRLAIIYCVRVAVITGKGMVR